MAIKKINLNLQWEICFPHECVCVCMCVTIFLKAQIQNIQVCAYVSRHCQGKERMLNICICVRLCVCV